MKWQINFKQNKVSIASLCVLFIYFIFAILGAAGTLGIQGALTTSEVYQNPSFAHWLGTDLFGRDIFYRAAQGTTVALSIGIMSALIALLIGTILGGLAGFFGGKWDSVVVWLMTTWDSIPYLLLLAGIAWALGSGLFTIFIALGFTSWVTPCRLIRMEVLKHKEQDYILAARSLGFGRWRILIGQILPHLWPLLLIQLGLCFVFAIKVEVILSFLGLGAEPGSASWGLMIDEGKQELAKGFWWNLLAASGFMFGLILSVNLLIEEARQKWFSSSINTQ